METEAELMWRLLHRCSFKKARAIWVSASVLDKDIEEALREVGWTMLEFEAGYVQQVGIDRINSIG